MHLALLGDEYFKDPPSELPQTFLSSLRSLLANYDPSSFWSFVRDGLKKIKNVTALSWILAKLYNEPKVREFSAPTYEFLLFGKMEESLLVQLQEPKKQDQSFNLLRLVQLIGKEELPQYQILQNYFAKTPSLTFNNLLSSFKDIVIKDKVNALMKDTKDFSPTKILSKEQLRQILDFILPVNIAALEFFVQEYLKAQNFSFDVKDDVILFKGVTGCGKSTMILYLLGYKIILRKDSQGLWQTVPEGQVNVQHRQIISKSSIHSVTNTCHLVKLLNSAQAEPVYFMDSPGSEDSRSINRIILNYLIMKKTYQYCRKIKFVEVIDTAQLIRQRINSLKKFTEYIVDSYNFGTIHDLRDNLTVLFNKCGCNYQHFKNALAAVLQCLYEHKYEDEFNYRQKIVLRFLLDAWNENQEYESCPLAIPIDFYNNQNKRKLLLQHLIQKKSCQKSIQIAKNMLKSQYMEKINTTLQYQVSSIRQWLDERRYDIVQYYYKQFWLIPSHFDQQQPSISILSLSVCNLIKKHFQTQLDTLEHLLRLGSSIVYNDDAMKTIKNCYSSIKQANIMKDQSWFNYATYIGQINGIQQQLLSAYQASIEEGSVQPQMIENYKKFAQIFQKQVNLLLPMLATKTQLEEDIISIINSRSNYNTIDDLYHRLKQVRQSIIGLNPTQPIDNRVETAFVQLITQKYGILQREFDQQMVKNSSPSLFETSPAGITQLLSAIQQYQLLNHSKVLHELKADQNQTTLLQRLAQGLIVRIQRFRDEERISRERIDNFKTFIGNYSQLSVLEQAMVPHLANLAEIFTAKRNRIIQEYSKIMQKCKKLLIDPNEEIDALTINISGGLSLCEIYSYYLGENFNKNILQLNLIQFIQQLETQYSSRNIVIFKIKQEILKFPLLVKRMEKIEVIQSCFPHLQPLFEQYHQACRIFVINFVKCIQMAIQENTRLNKFVTKIKQKQLFGYFQTIQQVWPAIQRLGHSSVCKQLVDKAFCEVFDNCKILVDSVVAYNLVFRMYEHDSERQVYIKDLINIFKFLFQLPQNEYFAERQKELDLKDKIIKRLMTELKQIGSEIMQNHKRMTRQFYERVKFKLYSFQMLENVALKDGKTKEQLKQVLSKLQEINTLADQFNPNAHEQTSFQLNQSLGLAFNYHQIFKKYYDSGLHKRTAKELAFNTFQYYLIRFIERMDEKSLYNTQQYNTLKDIRQFLQDKEKKISALNEILIKIEDQFLAFINESYQNAQNMHLSGDYKMSITELGRIQQMKVKSLEKERQIRQKIKDLKKCIANKLEDMQKFKESLQRNTSINIYQNYDKIMHLLQTSHKGSFQQRIESIIFNEMDQLRKIRIDSPNFESFKDKNIKISSIISMLHGHNRQVLTSQLDTIKKNLSEALTASINSALSYLDNYGQLMKLMYKQSIIGSSSDRLIDQRKIIFIKIQHQLNEKQKLEQKFEVLKRRFWVVGIASNILDTYKTINEQREEIYMDHIRMSSIDKEVQSIQKTISNPNATITLRQENVEKYNSVKYFRELKKHNHLFYNKNLFSNNQKRYCEKYRKIRSRMEANSQERDASNHVSNNCRIIGKIIEAISLPASEQSNPPNNHKAAPQ